MRVLIISILFISSRLPAQTNGLFFPAVVSTNGSILATNAEFRGFNGGRVCFLIGDSDYRVFSGSQLDPAVLSRLGTTAEKLAAAQAALDANNKRFTSEYHAAQQRIANQRISEALAIKQKAAEDKRDARAALDKRRQERESRTVIIRQPPGSGLTDNQQVGAYSP